jgi:mono/diheme cytochrome c family protein
LSVEQVVENRMEKRGRRTLVRAAGVVVLVVLAVAIWVYAASASMLGKTYPIPDLALPIPTDAAAVARGKHLVLAVGACVECHDASTRTWGPSA